MVKIGLVPAAGAGMRAYPLTSHIPKVMLQIAGKPIILRNIEILRDKFGIQEIYVITGYMAETIKSFLGDGSSYGVRITYIDCESHTVGLAKGILLAKDLIREEFVAILGDEVYINTDHESLAALGQWDFAAACVLMHCDDPKLIEKNYTVTLANDCITSLIEKPQNPDTDILGCGTYLFTTRIFDAIERTPVSKRSGKVELTDAISTLIGDGEKVAGFFLQGEYHNINFVEDYNYANYICRSKAFDQYAVSVIVPAYNEEESIAYVVKDFVGKVDEIFVVDNSSNDRTRDIALNAGARVETVKLKGYGDTIRYGLDNAKGDILIIVEADHSFRSKDLGKFLEYMKDADMVIGTRTTRQMIEQGANMQGLLRLGNVVVSKLVEVLWWGQEPRFTDVGCTYRAIWKDTYLQLKDRLEGIGPEFSPEMMIEVLRARKRIIEIPISYYERTSGVSKHSENYFKISKTALKMLRLIFKKRMGF